MRGNVDAPRATGVAREFLSAAWRSSRCPYYHGRHQNLSLSRRDGMDALVAQPREGVLTTRRFPLSGVLGTVRT